MYIYIYISLIYIHIYISLIQLYIYNKSIYASFLFCNAAASLPVVLKSICGADECHQILSGADEYQWC